MVLSERIRAKLVGLDTTSTSFSWLDKKQSKKTRLLEHKYYSGFVLNSQTYKEGDGILINTGCQFLSYENKFDVARILECYDNGNKNYKGFVKVQWFTFFENVRKSHKRNLLAENYPPLEEDIEVVKDLFTYESVVDLETISGHCWIEEVNSDCIPSNVKRPKNAVGPLYVCRFLYQKSSPHLVPLDEESIFKFNKSPLALKDISNSPRNKSSPNKPIGQNLNQCKSKYSGSKGRSGSQIENGFDSNESKRPVKRKLLDLDEEDQENSVKKKRRNHVICKSDEIEKVSLLTPEKENWETTSRRSAQKKKTENIKTKLSTKSPFRKTQNIINIGHCRGLQHGEISDLLSDEEYEEGNKDFQAYKVQKGVKSPSCNGVLRKSPKEKSNLNLSEEKHADKEHTLAKGKENTLEAQKISRSQRFSSSKKRQKRKSDDMSDFHTPKKVAEEGNVNQQHEDFEVYKVQKGTKSPSCNGALWESPRKKVQKGTKSPSCNGALWESPRKKSKSKINEEYIGRKRTPGKEMENTDVLETQKISRSQRFSSNKKAPKEKSYIMNDMHTPKKLPEEENVDQEDPDFQPHKVQNGVSTPPCNGAIRKSSRKRSKAKTYSESSEEEYTNEKRTPGKEKENSKVLKNQKICKSEHFSPSSKKTPKKETHDMNDFHTPKLAVKEELERTPRTPKTNKANINSTPTPKSKRVASIKSVATPKSEKKNKSKFGVGKKTPKRTPASKFPERNTTLEEYTSEFEQAKAQLHVSTVPSYLPCREDEFHQIYSFVEGKLFDSTGGCMYVSGVPGTGKTATVREVVRILKVCEEDGTVPLFQFLEVNAMKLTKPHQLWVQIWEGITGERVTPDHAYSLFVKWLKSSSGPKRRSVFLMLDELDLLWTKKQDVMYNLFDLSSQIDSRLIVVTIANTMDLPERMMISRVSSRLGLTRMTFQPYTFKQLQEIITSRLQGIKAFDSDAIELVARKVAAVSGDARRALDICRRAAELGEQKKMEMISSPLKSPRKANVLVGMSHVTLAITEMFSSPKVMAIRKCSQMVKYLLQAIMTEFTRTGIEEAVLSKVLDHLQGICRLDGLQPPSFSDSLKLVNVLSAQKIIFTEHSRLDLMLRIRLNISTEDVSYALSQQ